MNQNITPLVMPKWGLAMKEGTLSAWHVKEGQTITPGQEIMDVETDKIANAVEAADGGLLRRRIGEIGQVYPVKALLGLTVERVDVAGDIGGIALHLFVAGTAGDGKQNDGQQQQRRDTGLVHHGHVPSAPFHQGQAAFRRTLIVSG